MKMPTSLPLKLQHWAEIYVGMLSGDGYKEIAFEHGIAETTVKNYSQHIRSLLKFASRQELQAEVIRQAIAGNLWPYLRNILGPAIALLQPKETA